MIRKNITLFSMAAMSMLAMAAPKLAVDKIDPPHWWVGMKNTQLQLQIHGSNIRPADFTVQYPGVSVDSVVRLDGSPDWQYVYLNIAPDTKPGKMSLQWREGKRTVKKSYELRARKPMRGARGFDASDVLYLVMPDRFANGNPANDVIKTMKFPAEVDRKKLNVRHGGDIAGMMQHLDYIDSLGVTAVWVNPVLENDMPGGSYHGYATTDYYAIDPRFGANQEYAVLIDSLHNRGIKTVMDMIFNHCGSEHPWMSAPPASDWFNFQGDYHQTNYRLATLTDPYASDYDKKLTVDGWFVEAMPDLNQRNPHLMKYLSQNSIWWIEESQIDGIRMDTYPYADAKAMGEWIADVEREYPDFEIVGECWFGDTAIEVFWQRGSALAARQGMDTNLPIVMDFPLMIKSRDMQPFRETTDPWNGLNKLYDHLSLDVAYEDPMKVLRFLDNHDTERFILETPQDLKQWKQALTFLLTVPGIPQLYYGTELLMAGDRKLGDGNIRRDVPGGWAEDDHSEFTAAGRSDLQNEAYDFISTLLQWRKRNPEIMLGGMKHFMPTNGVYLYKRIAADGREAIVVMNGTDSELPTDMTRYLEIMPQGEEYTDILTGERLTLIPESKSYTFAPREVRVLVKQ